MPATHCPNNAAAYGCQRVRPRCGHGRAENPEPSQHSAGVRESAGSVGGLRRKGLRSVAGESTQPLPEFT